MDLNKMIHSLHGETLALQTLLGCLCKHMAEHSDAMRSVVDLSFDDAERIVEDIAIQYGTTARPEHTLKALKIIGDLRSNILGT